MAGKLKKLREIKEQNEQILEQLENLSENKSFFEEVEEETKQEFEEWLSSYIDKSTRDKLSELEKQILKMVFEYDKQIKFIEYQLKLIETLVPPEKGFIRSVYEMKNNLISERLKAIEGKISALKDLSKINIDIAKHLEKEDDGEVEDITDILK